MLHAHLAEVTQYTFENATNIGQSTEITHRMKKMVADMVRNIDMWKNGGSISLPNAAGGGENAIRPWAHVCYVLASCLRFNIFNFKALIYRRQKYSR